MSVASSLEDCSEVISSSETKEVSTINDQDEIETFTLSTGRASRELWRQLRYIRNLT